MCVMLYMCSVEFLRGGVENNYNNDKIYNTNSKLYF